MTRLLSFLIAATAAWGASPGVTLLNNIAPGTYTLQILGDGNDVAATAPVTVAEGQQATVSI